MLQLIRLSIPSFLFFSIIQFQFTKNQPLLYYGIGASILSLILILVLILHNLKNYLHRI